jgi:hypothetical protein
MRAGSGDYRMEQTEISSSVGRNPLIFLVRVNPETALLETYWTG